MTRIGDRDGKIERQQLWRCRRELEHMQRAEIREEPRTYGKEGRLKTGVLSACLSHGACGQPSTWLFIGRYAGAWLGRSYLVLETISLWQCFSFSDVMKPAARNAGPNPKLYSTINFVCLCWCRNHVKHVNISLEHPLTALHAWAASSHKPEPLQIHEGSLQLNRDGQHFPHRAASWELDQTWIHLKRQNF